jgi:YfiH family protein
MQIPFLTHPNFSFAGISYGFFTREGGVSEGLFSSLNCGVGSGDKPLHVRENLRRVTEALGVEQDQLVFCRQIHSKILQEVKKPWKVEARPRGDALLTQEKGIALAVLGADCAPVLFCDPTRNIIASAHAGWKGALGGVIETVIANFIAKGSKAEDIHAVIGPCIQQNSYEVGPEFPENFLKQDAENQNFFRPSRRDGHFLFDLPGYVLRRLNLAGIKNAHSHGADTMSDEERFFSYRRATLRKEISNGTLISAIVIKGAEGLSD